jgi:hypothetical protein
MGETATIVVVLMTENEAKATIVAAAITTIAAVMTTTEVETTDELHPRTPDGPTTTRVTTMEATEAVAVATVETVLAKMNADFMAT